MQQGDGIEFEEETVEIYLWIDVIVIISRSFLIIFNVWINVVQRDKK